MQKSMDNWVRSLNLGEEFPPPDPDTYDALRSKISELIRQELEMGVGNG